MEKHSSNRKYSLIDKEVFDWQEKIKALGKGLCTKKFKADVVVDGLSKYKLGDEIIINNEKCHITEVGKRCFFNECDLYRENSSSCKLKDGIAFAG